MDIQRRTGRQNASAERPISCSGNQPCAHRIVENIMHQRGKGVAALFFRAQHMIVGLLLQAAGVEQSIEFPPHSPDPQPLVSGLIQPG